MSVTERDLIEQMAKKHAVSPAAVEVVLAALRSGGGRMAQFSHADFGGMSQWSPGMSMVGDMFNTQLKAKLNGLCTTSRHIWTLLPLLLARDLARTRSATVQLRDREIGGRLEWVGRALSAHRTIFDTLSSPTAAAW